VMVGYKSIDFFVEATNCIRGIGLSTSPTSLYAQYIDNPFNVPHIILSADLGWSGTRLNNLSVYSSNNGKFLYSTFLETASPPNVQYEELEFFPPTNLTVSQSIDLIHANTNWDVKDGADGYILQRSINDPSFSSPTVVYTGSTNSFSELLYTFDVTYYYRVAATSLLNFQSDWSNVAGIYITIPIVANFSAMPLAGLYPLSVQFTDTSTGILTSWSWDFGDGHNSTDQNPLHVYASAGFYSVTLTASDIIFSNSITKTDYINVFVPTTTSAPTTTPSPVTVTYTNSTSVTATQYQVKLSGAMTCIGWIKSISVEDGDSLIPLAISDPYGNVLNTDAALRFEILRQGRDYRLQYLGSKTKPIDKNLKIKIDDGNWHMLSYESDENGNMTYSVDGILLPTEDGVDQYGLPYSVAKSLSNRVGGGTVWSPFLYKTRQIIYMYNWRFGKNFNLGLKWIGELMNIDKNSLGIS
jgi:PKD repeat protein